jgi:hypothetical protein
MSVANFFFDRHINKMDKMSDFGFWIFWFTSIELIPIDISNP